MIGLNSPKNRNALGWGMVRELGKEIEDLRDSGGKEGKGDKGWGTRVLVLVSEIDGCFCAGADLKERRGMGVEE